MDIGEILQLSEKASCPGAVHRAVIRRRAAPRRTSTISRSASWITGTNKPHGVSVAEPT